MTPLREPVGLEHQRIAAPLGEGDPKPVALKEQLEGTAEAPEASLERGEVAGAIQRAVSRLPEGQRVVLLLGAQEGIKYSEIGEMLGIPEGTVKSRMHSAVHALRDALSRGKTVR